TNHSHNPSLQVHIRFIFSLYATATTEIYTLSLHDALPISWWWTASATPTGAARTIASSRSGSSIPCSPSSPPIAAPCCWSDTSRSEEHTSELQSRGHLVCRLLLEKNKNHPTAAPRCDRVGR